MEWSVFLQDQINSVLSLRTKAKKCLCSGWAVWLLYISIKIFQAKVFVVIEDSYLRNCNWAYLFSGPAAACVFPAKSEQVTPPAYCGLNIWPQSNTLQLQPNTFRGQACKALKNWNFQQVWRLMLTLNVLVSYGVWRWEEGVWGFTQSVYECCLWTWLNFGSLWGSIWVFRPCMMQQMLYIGKSPKGEIPHTWHFWNIKIPKPPYVSSLKIIGLLHLFKFLGPSKENYNLQSLWITL